MTSPARFPRATGSEGSEQIPKGSGSAAVSESGVGGARGFNQSSQVLGERTAGWTWSTEHKETDLLGSLDPKHEVLTTREEQASANSIGSALEPFPKERIVWEMRDIKPHTQVHSLS